MKWNEFQCKRCRYIFNKKKQGFKNWDSYGERTKIYSCVLCSQGSSCIACKTHNKNKTTCTECYIDNTYGKKENVIYLLYKKDENLFKIGKTDRLKRRIQTLGDNYILLDQYVLNSDGVEHFHGEAFWIEGKVRKYFRSHRVYSEKDKRLDYFKSTAILEFDEIGFSKIVERLHNTLVSSDIKCP